MREETFSLINLLPGSLKVLRHAKNATSLIYRLRVVCIAFLFCSDRIRLYLPRLEKILHKLASILARRIVVEVGDVKYTLVDEYSLFIVLPEFETWMWDYLKVKKGEVFLDVGAHIGKYACQIAKNIGPEGMVIAIEPDPTNYNVLMKNLRLNGIENVVLFNIAAWNEDRKMELFIHERAGDHSLKNYWKPNVGITVQAKRLDDVLKKLEVKVHWVKIDTEGAELEVLHGLEKTLKKDLPNMVVETQGSNIEPLKRFTKELGYRIRSIPAGRDPTLGIWHFYCTRE